MSQYWIVSQKTGKKEQITLGGEPLVGDAICLPNNEIVYVQYRLWNTEGMFYLVVDATQPFS